MWKANCPPLDNNFWKPYYCISISFSQKLPLFQIDLEETSVFDDAQYYQVGWECVHPHCNTTFQGGIGIFLTKI